MTGQRLHDRALIHGRKRLRALASGLTLAGLRARVVGPRVLLNSIPKAGTNLLERALDLMPGLRGSGVRTLRGWNAVDAATLRAMTDASGTNPADVLAAIGPSIGPDHYEIGEDVITRVREAFQEDAATLLVLHGERTHFNLWEANRLSLTRAGVRQVEIAGLCTACHPEDWYSHRAQKGKTGRFGAMIGLK